MKKDKPSAQRLVIFAIGAVFVNIFSVYIMDHYPKNPNVSVTEFIVQTLGMAVLVGAINFAWALVSLKLKIS